jgi:hypothetical protein
MDIPFLSGVEVSRVAGTIVSVEHAFTWCRIDGYAVNHPEYGLVDSLILAAEGEIEAYLNKIIRKGVFVFNFTGFCAFDVNKYPCISIDLVKYHNGSTYVDLDVANYEKFKYSNEGVLIRYKGTLPTVQDRLDAVKVTVTCGYELASVPNYIKTAMQLMVGEWYNNRDNGKKEFPTVAESILRKHRMMRV